MVSILRCFGFGEFTNALYVFIAVLEECDATGRSLRALTANVAIRNARAVAMTQLRDGVESTRLLACASAPRSVTEPRVRANRSVLAETMNRTKRGSLLSSPRALRLVMTSEHSRPRTLMKHT